MEREGDAYGVSSLSTTSSNHHATEPAQEKHCFGTVGGEDMVGQNGQNSRDYHEGKAGDIQTQPEGEEGS